MDWEAIERDYRAGFKTLRQLGDEHSISHAAIAKRAKRDDWSRDLEAQIKSRADSLVTKSMVTSAVTTETRVSDKELIEANAQALVHVRLSHRRDIHRSRSLLMRLMDELELQVGPQNVALLEELGELLRKPDENGNDKLNDLYQKIMSLPGRAKTMKDMGETLRVLVGLERQAFGLVDGPSEGDGIGGVGKTLTDAERAVRLSRFINGNPAALAAVAALAGGKK
ncbi:MAG: hypothetical protein EOO27_19865 [Comamonadaceae bacterium]|nr:MAG: hypothetical protein EOO27_19865 [Comamonadaceae bacterium]